MKLTVTQLAEKIMHSIDADIPFRVLSERTAEWLESWSQELAQLMQLNTHTAIEQTLKEGIKEGRSIQEIELELKDLPEFSRKRARVTAVTEVLTASSVAQHESYVQSPAVTGKRWKHSGGKRISPEKVMCSWTARLFLSMKNLKYQEAESSACFREIPSFLQRARELSLCGWACG
ncbi:hypothetical protein BsIDN1_45680 [Bacillus safensis]|uniref:Phage head morphogenesis domain-containing protein n=1 Tax=Bacillus safensis TaxID=561879 RepID=A0A5S9MBQ5_BACIA|nr:hypothetical protein BsIDN1_45680 [Bacillus safensis]